MSKSQSSNRIITYFLLCSRERRKIFSIPGVQELFYELVETACQKKKIEIIEIKFSPDYVEMKLAYTKELSANDVMNLIRKSTSQTIRKQFDHFSKMPSLWIKDYYCSSTRPTEEEINNYIESKTKKNAKSK